MPNRILKESIRTSKKVNALSDFDFRLWAYLITFADDYGRAPADTAILKGFVFPLRDSVTKKGIEQALRRMESAGLILLYEYDGEPYLCFPNWASHQRIQAKKAKYPEPPKSTVSHGGSPLESNPIQSESNPNPNQESESKRGVFTPPTQEEVRLYCEERENTVDPERFVDFYSSKGWMVGKNRMKDWKACVRTWEKKEGTVRKETKPDIIPTYDDSQNPSFDPKRLEELLERKRM